MVMKEAVDREDFERDGLDAKPKKKKKVEIPEPAPLTGAKPITLDDLPLSDLEGFTETPHNRKNEDGVRFIGYDVIIRVKDAKKPITGWMAEGDLIRLRQLTRK